MFGWLKRKPKPWPEWNNETCFDVAREIIASLKKEIFLLEKIITQQDGILKRQDELILVQKSLIDFLERQRQGKVIPIKRNGKKKAG